MSESTTAGNGRNLVELLLHLAPGQHQAVAVNRQRKFAPGTIPVFDHGYTDYNWFERLTRQNVHFVARLKANAEIINIEDLPLPARKGLVRHQVVRMAQQAEESIRP